MGWWLLPFALKLLQDFLNMTNRANRTSGYYEVNTSTGSVTRKTNPFVSLFLLLIFFVIVAICIVLPEYITPVYLGLLGFQIVLHIVVLVKNIVAKKRENKENKGA